MHRPGYVSLSFRFAHIPLAPWARDRPPPSNPRPPRPASLLPQARAMVTPTGSTWGWRVGVRTPSRAPRRACPLAACPTSSNPGRPYPATSPGLLGPFNMTGTRAGCSVEGPGLGRITPPTSSRARAGSPPPTCGRRGGDCPRPRPSHTSDHSCPRYHILSHMTF